MLSVPSVFKKKSPVSCSFGITRLRVGLVGFGRSLNLPYKSGLCSGAACEWKMWLFGGTLLSVDVGSCYFLGSPPIDFQPHYTSCRMSLPPEPPANPGFEPKPDFETKQPMGPGAKKNNTTIIIIIAVAAAVLILGGCFSCCVISMLVPTRVETEDQKDAQDQNASSSDRSGGSSSYKGITRAGYEAIKTGMSESKVEKILDFCNSRVF